MENIALNIEDFSQTCVTSAASAGRDNLSRQKSGQGISKWTQILRHSIVNYARQYNW